MRRSTIPLLAALAFAPCLAHAENPVLTGDGFDTHLFRPAMDSKGLFSVNGSEVLGHLDMSFGLVTDYAYSLLRVNDLGQKSPRLISHSFQGTGHFNLGLWHRLVVGVAIPVNLLAGDEQVAGTPPRPLLAGQWFTGALDSQHFAFLALHSKLRLLRAEDGLGLAVGGQIGVPVSGAPRDAAADPGLWFWPMVMVEKPLGSRVRLLANVGYRGHTGRGTELTLRDGTFRDGDRVTYGGGLSVRVLDSLDLVAETYGTYLLSNADRAVKASNEVVGGIKVFVERSSYLMLGAGPRYTTGFEAADFRAFLGFIFEPSVGDKDGDGIKDDVDKCPNEPEDKDGFQDDDGCPDLDNDGDGIPDVEDRCPNVPETFNGFQDKDGCPDQIPAPPPPPPPPPDPSPPPPPPPPAGVLIQENSIVILEKIQFATGSAVILATSSKILDAVATTLKTHPEFLLVEVEGHADARDSDAYNLRLTQARATSVVTALVKAGVDKSRLRAKGYGKYCPEDPANTPAAWDKNRRVEFKIVKTGSGPTGVELGCAAAGAKGVRSDPIP